MHAFLFKAVPTSALRPLAEALAKQLSVVAHKIVLLGNVEHNASTRRFQDLLYVVELRCLCQVADVAGVQK